jgi:hypothetical protein
MRKELLDKAKYMAEESTKLNKQEVEAEATFKRVKQLETECKRMISNEKKA